ncbi:unnamed protein product [Phytomonas sp. Hart1]|nr:unnamed protein product [Phytomonas sp. Hart1]|eukprot:CCW71391.1 unnamed protein product [Phytomonas sp. isolate Hart1]
MPPRQSNKSNSHAGQPNQDFKPAIMGEKTPDLANSRAKEPNEDSKLELMETPSTDLSISRGRSEFYADSSVPAAFRVKPGDYPGGKFNRGHLAAAQLHKTSQAELNATFNLNANILPQDKTLNAGDWLRLENFTRRILTAIGETTKSIQTNGDAAGEIKKGRLFVVSGPAFIPTLVIPHTGEEKTENGNMGLMRTFQGRSSSPHKQIVQYEMIGRGSQTIAVPTHLFKVFLAEFPNPEDSRPRFASAAFLLPNNPISEERPLTHFQVPMEKLEHATGLCFFPNLNRSRVEDLCCFHRCDETSGLFFRRYRQIARIQTAETIPELRAIYAHIDSESARKSETVDRAIQKEYQQRMKELTANTVYPIDKSK